MGYTNIYSPILDIAQDPRWGRVVECYGEDPFLVGELGKRMIKGLQARGAGCHSQTLCSNRASLSVGVMPVLGTDPHVAPREMRTLYIGTFP